MKRAASFGAGILAAVFLAFCTGSIAPAADQEPLVKGRVTTPSGAPLKSYPVTIQGTTAAGDKFNSYVTTDQKGAFEVRQIPPGAYTAFPAGQPESAVGVTIDKKSWFGTSQEPKDLGNFTVAPGSKLRP